MDYKDKKIKVKKITKKNEKKSENLNIRESKIILINKIGSIKKGEIK